VGKAVLEGNMLAVSEGRGVSVDVSVGAREAVSVGDGICGVSVTGEKEVFVGALVATNVGETGVAVNVQARELNRHKIKKSGRRLIYEIHSPVPNNIPKVGIVQKLLLKTKTPALGRGSLLDWLMDEDGINVLLCRPRVLGFLRR
jgi:hypothetical protein